MTSQSNKRKFSWWPGDVEWFSQKVDKWFVSSNGYSKLRASISTRSSNSIVDKEEAKNNSSEKWRRGDRGTSVPTQSSEPPLAASKLKMCLKYGEEVYKTYSEKFQGGSTRQIPVSRSFSVKEGKKPIQRQDWARSSYSLKRRNMVENGVPKRESCFKSKTMQRFTSNVVPAEVIFEKCKPKERQRVPCESESCWEEVAPCCVQSTDVIYYPFREEDCVVCKYLLNGAKFRMNIEPLERFACSNDGCHFLYGSKSFPCDTGQLHSGCKMTQSASLVNTMSRCTLRETRIANDEPMDPFYENNFQGQPTININQNYIEVRYDDVNNINSNAPPAPDSSDTESEDNKVYRKEPELPPPTYMSVMRQESSRGRPRKCTYQHQDGEDRFYLHDSPSSTLRYPPSYDSCANGEQNGRRNINRSNILANRRTNTLPRQNITREGPRYRSNGRFSHSFYDTERAVREAFDVNGNSWNTTSTGLRRGTSFSYYKPPSSTIAVDPNLPRYHLREVDLKSSNPLRNVMSFRNRSGKSKSRRKKSVVVGEDGFQGPMWPRVLLTFDRGVTPNAPPCSPGQYSAELDT